MTLQVRELNDPVELGSLARDWQELLAQTADATFFQSLPWLQTYWRHFGEGQKLRVMAIGQGRRLRGIVPLTVVKERTKAGTMRVLTYPLDGWSSFYGPIGPEPAASLAAAFEHVRRTRRDWDVIEPRWIRSADNDPDLAARCLAAAGFEAETQPWEHAALVRLTGDWDGYFRSIDGHQRNNLRRAEKRLKALGELSYVRYRPGGKAAKETDPRWDLYDACEQVAALSWQGQANDGTTLSSPRVRECYRDAHPQAVEAGALDLSLLQLDGRPIAFGYSYQMNGYVYLIKMGFDPELASGGAGKTLLQRLIEDSYARGDRIVDLGPESFHYKKFWLNAVESSYRATHFAAASPRAQALRLGRWVRTLKGAPTPEATVDLPAMNATMT